MSLEDARLIEVIDVHDTLGEGVVWRDSDSTVWWVDVEGRRVHCLAWPGLALQTFATPERASALAFVEGRDDILLVSFESGFALWSPQSGGLVWLARPKQLGDGVRLNDGRVDAEGRFWVGSMAERRLAAGELPPGALYRFDEAGAAAVVAGIHISNGICWSPDGRRMYFADSMRGEVYAAPFDAAHGAPGRFELFTTFAGAAPDGAVTDAAGNYWSALWGGSRVGIVAPSGEEIGAVEVDALQPSCPAFGGASANLLFVTTAQQSMSAEKLASSPRSGSLFVFETGAQGNPVSRARLSPATLARIAA